MVSAPAATTPRSPAPLALENAYVADGVSINDPAFGGLGVWARSYGALGSGINQSFVKEVQIKTGGFEPQYGHASGGIVQIVTKSGGTKMVRRGWPATSSPGPSKLTPPTPTTSVCQRHCLAAAWAPPTLKAAPNSAAMCRSRVCGITSSSSATSTRLSPISMSRRLPAPICSPSTTAKSIAAPIPTTTPLS